MNKSIHFLVSGRVQGVFFRMETKQRALRHTLTGWVRNMSDGKVEGVASGEESKLNEFHQWLLHGPELARVTRVEVEELDHQEIEGFTIK